MDYSYVWGWYSDIEYSVNIEVNLHKMKFLQSFIYKTLRIDADKCFNDKVDKNKTKKNNTEG